MPPLDPLVSDRPLIVYIDYKSPYAFVAKDPTREMALALGVAIDWRPMTLDIPSFLGSARLDDRGRVAESRRTPAEWSSVRYAYRDARRYAALRGYTLRGTTKIWDSSLAAIGLLWARRQGDSVVDGYTDRVYERFWKRELDIEDPEVVTAVLRDAGAVVDGFGAFAAGEGRDEHDALQVPAFEAGVFGVPTYVVEGEVFFGREHLPRVRWLLGGRRGPAPDIAYRGFEPRVKLSRGLVAPARGTRITVFTDLTSPAAFLAADATLALAEPPGVDLDFQPLLLPRPAVPPPAKPDENRGTRHRRMRASYRALDLERYARAGGVPVERLHGPSDGSAAALGLLFTRDRAPDRVAHYVRRAFDAHFREHRDLADAAIVADLLREVGVSEDGFAEFLESDGPPALAACTAEAHEIGLLEVPSFRIGDEIFMGRQHLPMLRWLVTGRDGPPPI